MFRRTCVLCILLGALSLSFAQSEPWNTKATFRSYIVVDGPATLKPFEFGPWLDQMATEFDQRPDLVYWSDLPDSSSYVQVGMRFTYEPWSLYPGEPQDSVWWMDGLTWNQIQPYLRGVRVRVSTADTTTFNVPAGAGTVTLKTPGSYTALSPKIPIDQLPLPTPDELYAFWVEPTGPDLPWNRTIDTLRAVTMTHETALDTMFWLHRNWESAPPALFERMLAQFPDDTRLLRHFFWHYYHQANCDSLTRVGNQLIIVWQGGESTYLMDNMANFNAEQAIQDVESHINHICGGGQPDSSATSLGWSSQ